MLACGRHTCAAIAASLAATAAAALLVLAAAPASIAATGPPGCAWGIQVGSGGVDGYGADLNASYWVTSMLATPGAGLVIAGSFPQARYMSISAYNATGAPTGTHLYDAEIQPATGTNPFQPGAAVAASGTYAVRVLAEPEPATPAPNTLYVGANEQLVTVLYRVYDSDSPTDPTGGAGLPQVSTTFAGIVTQTAAGCVTGPGDAERQTIASVPPALTSADAPAWGPVEISSLPNDDASYLETQIDPPSGSVVVIRMRTPTFPDTNGGDPPWAPAQVRYWSICDYGEYTLVPYGCVSDHEAIQDGAVATFVISTAADQPGNATPADGVNWLPWGSPISGIIIYRQILAAPSFSEAIGAIPPGETAQAAMDSYYPEIAYCSVAQFEAVGATGCLVPQTPTAGPPGPAGPAGPTGAAGSTPTEAPTSGSEPSRAAVDATLSTEIAPTGNGVRIASVLKARGYTFNRYRLPEAGTVKLQWSYRAGQRTILIAAGSLSLAKGTTGKLQLHLVAGVDKLLARLRRVSLRGSARFTASGEIAITLTRLFTLSDGVKVTAATARHHF